MILKRPNLTLIIVAILLIAMLVFDLLWDLRRHQFYRWLVLFIYFAVLAISAFFENRWISKQADQLKARYRVINVSMWIFLSLAAVSTAPNIFMAGDFDKSAFYPVSMISFILLGMTFMRRRELIRELAERSKSHSI
jgi:NADH:ubiquinone oxidoreductase subunit 2 (subunit N)